MTFQYIEPTEEQKKLMDKFRYYFEELKNQITSNVELSRGSDLCIAKLEEANFWLNKSITKNDLV